MGWTDKPDPVIEQKRKAYHALILKEIEAATAEQLAVAITVLRKVRTGDPRALALVDPKPESANG